MASLEKNRAGLSKQEHASFSSRGHDDSTVSTSHCPHVYPLNHLARRRCQRVAQSLSTLVRIIRYCGLRQSLFHHSITPHWSEYPLTPSEYELLEKSGKRDEIFALKTPKYEIHEVVRGQFIGEIDNSLQKFLKTNIILEIAHSQTSKNLDHLATEYISGTAAEVRNVVGIQQGGARRTKEVTVKVSKHIHNDHGEIAPVDVEQTEIRSKSGQKREDTDDQVGIHLMLEIFAYCRKEDEYPGSGYKICIGIDRLYEIDEEAERELTGLELEEKGNSTPIRGKYRLHLLAQGGNHIGMVRGLAGESMCENALETVSETGGVHDVLMGIGVAVPGEHAYWPLTNNAILRKDLSYFFHSPLCVNGH
ncbi:uncharacterized protein A1O5_13335 [Cladophialophora psammophila CBS 110553]|uniref:Uncharacterized protein n=1 Tax=Cladophialophora psammophila CBS 110553 TaxID=1182543 RepID=W9VMR2_9EURO|nr:uncharacterized protein A1O5_13335 [Cladophialophora psammophila CBS 110553]EXJ53401.1 hypothetical protein A1O5_13335 [Cladophialophora psammophila CBS 110553]